ncbi:MAG: hypothetical protein FJ308_14700 [Planctomycetes bacterium]|nr:hypothetical protein [Planctomycetota bacterium]
MTYISDHPELKDLIADHRDVLNQCIRERLHAGAKFQPADFLMQLDQAIGPVLMEILPRFPERAGMALTGLCDVVLDLLVAGQFRTEVTTPISPFMSRLWNRLLPRLATPIAIDPKRVAASLSNALIQIAQESPQVADRWLQNFLGISDDLQSVDSVLHAGRFLAWTSGLAHYRKSVLEYAATMPVELLQLCLAGSLSAPGTAGLTNAGPVNGGLEGDGREWIERLQKDPWGGVVVSRETSNWRRVGHVGAFRGFGGRMLAPPLVWSDEAGLLASDGKQIWKIHADRFGAIMTRFDGISVEGQPWKSTEKPTLGKWLAEIPELGKATSFANEGNTLVWTEATSFHVFIGANLQAVDTISIVGV